MKFQSKFLKKLITKYKSLALLTLVFAIGFIFGACFYSAGLSSGISLMTADLAAANLNTAARFLHFVSAPLIFATLMCLFGFCAIGQPFPVFVIFIRGAGLSLSIAGIYSFYGLKGLPITLLLILPPTILSNIALIACAKWSIKFSGISLQRLRKKDATEMTPVITHKLEELHGPSGQEGLHLDSNSSRVSLARRYAPVLLLIAISGLLDGVLNALFGWLL